MTDPIEVATYDPAWPARFSVLGATLRHALGATALRIDHIGSTSIPGLDAKPIIDVQVSVASFDPFDPICAAMEEIGFRHRPDNPDRSKRYFRELPDTSRTHLHFRRSGSWPEQFALLFRDYLRAHDSDRDDYARLKHELAAQFRFDRAMYVDAKAPFIWSVMQKADVWSQAIGWVPGPSDA
jgi:GrpB-like predicted nucleotidyltransferase (UPF0157 family)